MPGRSGKDILMIPCFPESGCFVGVPVIRALLLGVHIRARDVWKVPYGLGVLLQVPRRGSKTIFRGFGRGSRAF